MSDDVERLGKHVSLRPRQIQQGLYGATSKLPDALEKAALARGKNPDFSGSSDVTIPLDNPSDMAKKRVSEGMQRISDVADEYQRESTRGIKPENRMKKGGKVAKVRGHGIEIRGKTKGRFV